MTNNAPLLFAAAAVVYVVTRPKPKRKPALTANQAPGQLKDRSCGLVLSEDGFSLEDWNAWMECGPEAVRLALADGATDAEDIAANAFRRLFPTKRWPPPEDSPLNKTWDLIVASVGRTLERPFQTRLRVVS